MRTVQKIPCRTLGTCWGLLEASGDLLEVPEGFSGASAGFFRLEPLLKASGTLLEAPGVFYRLLDCFLGTLGRFWGASGSFLEGFWEGSGGLRGVSWKDSKAFWGHGKCVQASFWEGLGNPKSSKIREQSRFGIQDVIL